MLAVVEIGGKQFKVEKDSIIDVDKVELNAKDKLIIDRVLLTEDKGKVTLGTPVIDGASVTFEVLEQLKDNKIIVFKFKRKTGYKVTQGHRQRLSRLKVVSIDSKSGASKASSAKKSEASSSEKKTAATKPSAKNPNSETTDKKSTADKKSKSASAKKTGSKE